jgi:hypothetical protein
MSGQSRERHISQPIRTVSGRLKNAINLELDQKASCGGAAGIVPNPERVYHACAGMRAAVVCPMSLMSFISLRLPEQLFSRVSASSLRRNLRMGSGLVLFTYIAARLLNHALGLISLSTAERECLGQRARHRAALWSKICAVQILMRPLLRMTLKGRGVRRGH